MAPLTQLPKANLEPYRLRFPLFTPANTFLILKFEEQVALYKYMYIYMCIYIYTYMEEH